MDVLAVRECVGRAVARAEAKTPTLVEARTYRFRGHSMRDPAAAVYRTKNEVEEEKRRDPITLVPRAAPPEGRWTRRAGRRWSSGSRRVSPMRSSSADASPEPPAEWLTADVYA